MVTKSNQYVPQIQFHPGETLAEKLEELGMGPKEFSVRTNKPEKTIIAVLSAKSSITPEMAVKFEHVLKIPAHFWLKQQSEYDEYLAREENNKMVENSIAWAKLFPVKEMIKLGWISEKQEWEEKTKELLSFFCISNHKAWENYYLNQELKTAFRISLKNTQQPHSISAWLRHGEVAAAKIESYSYSEAGLRALLPELKLLMAKQPEDFFVKLQTICLKAGVKVIYTPCLSHAPISGATRWINDNPVIQISGRYKRNDNFWFTFFHEAGHILLHGKKDIFLENVENCEESPDKEQEANNFAIKWTFSFAEEKQLLSKGILTEPDIQEYANQINTHPAMIIGRLQHKKLISYSVGKKFLVPVDLSDKV